LGYFPDGAFEDYAKKKNIIVALNSENICMGYLLYRISRNQVILVHLCVDRNYRKQGIAKQMIEYLCKDTQIFEGIGLRCRRDFKANTVWPHLGFSAQYEKAGRSYSRKLLTFWWLDYGHPTIFSYYNKEIMQTKIIAVIDANVFFDFKDINGDIESNCLLADWLQNYLILCVTDEILNEIDRNDDEKKRKYFRSYANTFQRLQHNFEKYNQLMPCLEHIFPQRNSLSDESDKRQIAKAIAGGAHYFITRDDNLLKIKDKIYTLGITLIRPCDLINHLDENLNEKDYQPMRLAGSTINISLLKSSQSDLLSEKFLNNNMGEKKKLFDQKLRIYMSNIDTFKAYCIKNHNEQVDALIVYKRDDDLSLEVPMLRVAKGALSSTIARNLILKSIILSISENRCLLKFTDPYLSSEVIQALIDNHFVFTNNEWKKFGFNMIIDSKELLSYINSLMNNSFLKNEKDLLEHYFKEISIAINNNNIDNMLNIERAFWPMKIKDLNIPIYMIPIKSHWAIDLFDENSAKQTLFGARTDTVLNRENVYYRSAKPKVVSAPARILWYICKDEHASNSMSIMACSYLNRVDIGKPKEQYRQYRRLGVYELKDILKLAKYSSNNDVMAINFSDTELFKRPVYLDLVKKIFSCDNKKVMLRSPSKITRHIFENIYSYGMKYC
jgi:putative PIN family toxin of toxin-antitoxin system